MECNDFGICVMWAVKKKGIEFIQFNENVGFHLRGMSF